MKTFTKVDNDDGVGARSSTSASRGAEPKEGRKSIYVNKPTDLITQGGAFTAS